MWVDREYTITVAPVVDPDGDPVRYGWVWLGGPEEWGSASSPRVFSSTGFKEVRLITEDDPSGRSVQGCPPMQPLVSFRPAQSTAFMSEPEWDVAMSPTPGESCRRETRVWTEVTSVIVLDCVFRTSGFSQGLEAVTFALDGDPIAEVEYPGTYTFEGYAYPTYGPYDMDACARAANDKYGREFCAPTYRFLNLA